MDANNQVQHICEAELTKLCNEALFEEDACQRTVLISSNNILFDGSN